MRPSLVFFVTVLLCCCSVSAQTHHEFLATLNYNPFSYARIDSIPGIMWLQDNAAYDENGKRFIFQGTGAAQTAPNDLVVLNALTGAVIVQSPLGANLGSGYHVGCLQYDNSCDTLYGIVYNGSVFESCWIEELNGTVHIKSTIAGITAYAPGVSALDEHHHRLFMQGSGTNGLVLVTIDVRTGVVLWQVATTVSTAVYLEYNNTTNHLYAISVPGRLDSINPATGVQYAIGGVIAQLGLYQTGIWAINEATGEFIFGAHPSAASGDSLYTVDLQTGALLSREYYAYANGANPALENLIFYCMDQQTQTLYALNWGIDTTKSHPNGFYEDEPGNALLIYPVPSCGPTIIQIEQNAAYGLMNVYDFRGKKCFVMQTGYASQLQADFSFLADGVYTLEFVADSGELIHRKLVIQH